MKKIINKIAILSVLLLMSFNTTSHGNIKQEIPEKVLPLDCYSTAINSAYSWVDVMGLNDNFSSEQFGGLVWYFYDICNN